VKKKIIILVVLASVVALYVGFAVTAKYGEIVIEGTGATMKLESLFRAAKVSGGGAAIRARTGRYRPMSIVLESDDPSSGGVWTITSRGPWGGLDRIVVKEDSTTRLRVGPPLVLSAVPSGSGRTISFSFAVKGCSGETYQTAARNGRRSAALPPFEIVAEDGRVLASGKFEYG